MTSTTLTTSTTPTLPTPVCLGHPAPPAASVDHRPADGGAGAPPDAEVTGAGRRAGARRRWSAVVADGSDAGMATAEYAIAMIAAVGFASLLVAVLSSGTVRGLLTGLVTSALSIG